MKFSDCASELKEAGLVKKTEIKADCSIQGITYNSRDVAEGFLFVCKGAHFKEAYLTDAISRGAAAYVSETEYEAGRDIEAIIVKDIRAAMPVIAKAYYGDLSAEIKMIGITGTKGKSTTTYFLRGILDDCLTDTKGVKSAICSGIDNYDGVNLEEAHLTTPEIMELYYHMNNAVNSGIPFMEMEVSSQALKYDRVAGVQYELACFLNIGTDHISDMEHKDFEDYFGSKLLIFDQANSACINMDSDEFDRIEQAAAKTGRVVRFSEKNAAANVYAENIVSDRGKVEFDAVIRDVPGYEDARLHIDLAAFGVINVRNAVAAVAMAAMLGVPGRYIVSGLGRALTPGRMEVYRSADEKYIGIVDYAHNRLSYEALLSAISGEFPDRNIVMVFGSTGGKAINRREELGSIAGKYCSHVVLTEDDGGEEDIPSICREIAGYLGDKCSYEIIPDRPEAIRHAVEQADEKTIVIAAGKAREHYQKRGDHYIEIEADVDVMRKAIALKGEK